MRRLVCPAVALWRGSTRIKWCANRGLEKQALGEETLFTEVPAVVAPEDDERVLRLPDGLERVEDAAELGVHVADAGIVGVQRGAGLGGGEIAVGVEIEIAAGVAAMASSGKRRLVGEVRRQGQFLGLVKVEEFLRRLERDVGFLEPDREEEGLRGGVVILEKLDRVRPRG